MYHFYMIYFVILLPITGNYWYVWLRCWAKPTIEWINNTIRT